MLTLVFLGFAVVNFYMASSLKRKVREALAASQSQNDGGKPAAGRNAGARVAILEVSSPTPHTIDAALIKKRKAAAGRGAGFGCSGPSASGIWAPSPPRPPPWMRPRPWPGNW